MLTAARTLMAEDPNFTVKALLDKTNITRARFRRHFAGKMQLLSVLAGEDVRELTGLLEAAQPAAQPQAQTMRIAVGAGAMPVIVPAPMPVPELAAPPTDQWLERRLRVFERALAAMEKRQEKSEQNFIQAIALLKERLDGQAAEPAAAAPVAVETAAPVMTQQPAPQQAEIIPAAIVAEEPEEPVSEKEIHDFIAHAREAARNAAALAEAAPPKVRNTPWLAWGGAVAALLVLMVMGLVIASRAQTIAAPMTGAGSIHRQLAQKGLPRVMALADNGDALAETILAMSYLRGAGVPTDEHAAMRWATAAAAQGQPVAEYLLGTLYIEDDRDDAKAAHWFEAAAAQGNIRAMHNLAIAYAQGQGVPADPARAVSWLVRAATGGYRDSQFDLAVMYERGQGVPQDAVAALKWYLIAANNGDAASMARAEFLKTQLKAVDVNAASDAADAFVPKPVGSTANDMATL